MHCASCGQDKAPIVELATGAARNEFGASSAGAMRAVYTCGNPACHATLGPVKREEVAPAPPPVALGPQPLQGLPVAMPVQPGIGYVTKTGDIPGAVPPSGYVAQMRARLEFLDKVLAPLNEEREFLRSALNVVARRRRKMPNNVISIEAAKA